MFSGIRLNAFLQPFSTVSLLDRCKLSPVLRFYSLLIPMPALCFSNNGVSPLVPTKYGLR